MNRFKGGSSGFFLAILGTWATDTFAYGVGRLIGRRKIAPRISPGKTLEGAVAGLAGGARNHTTQTHNKTHLPATGRGIC